jgi:16S rRNA (cytosine1402-N4)-methyltransferase
MAHLPVMLNEVIEHLAIREDGSYLDCTFGRGGHSTAILQYLGENGRLLALDRDCEAITCESAQALANDPRFTLQQMCFSQFPVTQSFDGILMDLGVSSPQLDAAERGFSFLRDGPLDMRMNNQQGISAQEWLEKVSEAQLVKVLFEYGEERFARRIAAAIIAQRQVEPLVSTRQLAKLIESVVPGKSIHKHPATRTFQAIRIEINQELEELQRALRQALIALKPGGRLVVIAFHSLEDRIVKQFIQQESGAKHDPGRLPVRQIDIVKGALKKVGKAIKAGPAEVQVNVRARSAIMRVAEKL